MKLHSLSFFVAIVLFSPIFNGQTLTTEDPSIRISPGGYFDEVRDREGRTYSLNSLQIILNQTYSTKYNNNIYVASTTTCQAGIFKVFFANGSGMEIVGNTTHNGRRITVCEVLQNISGLLNFTTTPTFTVNILVDDIGNLISPATPSNNLTLGVASSFYAFPNSPTSANPGIIENQIQKTIKSQQDAWLAVSSPFISLGGGNFYHGVMGFNFANPSFTWHTNYSGSLASSNDIDLYTVILHELTHALGFGSLINFNGTSKFGSANNYYSLYDKFLHDKNLSPLLSSTGCSPQYSLAFNGNTLSLAPNCTTTSPIDVTTCSVACSYSSSNMGTFIPVYTPDCYDGGSSLSHFEDMCYPTNTPSNNNVYFTMSNAQTVGMNKRFLTREERKVLCDLGYSVSTTYTSNALNASHSYTSDSPCSSPNIWGVNDGIVNGAYTYTSIGGPFTISISSGTNAIISNDASTTTSAICVETVYANGTVAVNSGIITFSPAANFWGTVLLRYIPVDGSGNQGNITYIFGYVFPPGCSPISACDLVQNGGFETSTGCGPIATSWMIPNTLDCWSPFTLTPDLLTSSCTYTLGDWHNNPLFSYPTFTSTPPASVSSFLGLFCQTGSVTLGFPTISESVSSYLGSPLVNGQNYVLSFWAFQLSGTFLDPHSGVTATSNSYSVPVVMCFGSSGIPLAPSNFNTFPMSGVNTILSPTLANSFNFWKPYTYTFTFSAATPTAQSLLYVGMHGPLTYTNLGAFSPTATSYFYIAIDDISIKPLSQACLFTLPATSICPSMSFTDLAQYASVPGGTFSGTGVTSSGSQYHFNFGGGIGNGIYNIAYTYSDNINCPQTVYQQVVVTNSTNLITLSYSTNGCSNNSGTLSIVNPTPSYSYTWQPANQTGTNVAVTTAVPTIYTVTSTSNSLCTVIQTISVMPNIPTGTLSSSSSSVCSGGSFTLSAIGTFTSISWQPGSNTSTQIIVNPSVSTTYTALITSSYGCTLTPTISVTVMNCCQGMSYNSFSSPTISSTTYTSPILFKNSFTVQPSQTLTLKATEFRFDPNVKLTVANGGFLNIDGAHLYSCENDMWQGIEVLDGGRVHADYNSSADLASLIEDAITAIDVSNHSTSTYTNILDVHNTIFNKNYISINIANYTRTVTTYPFFIDNCVFTCRDLNSGITPTNWPSAGMSSTLSGAAAELRTVINPTTGLNSPFINSSFSITTLKNPYSSQQSQAAINLYTVGITTSTNMYGITIGNDANIIHYNVFDAHRWGILGINSSMILRNNVFQNTIPSYMINPYIGAGLVKISSSAVFSYITTTLNAKLDMACSNISLGNRFWNCPRAVLGSNIYLVDIGFSLFRSIQSSATPTIQPGNLGVGLSSNRFAYYIHQNEFTNINNGVNVTMSTGPFAALGGTNSSNGTYASAIRVVYNTISSGTATNAYVNNAITIGSALSNTVTIPSSSVYPFVHGIAVDHNTLTSVYRGILLNGNAAQYPSAISDNVISLANDPNNVLQYGINITNTSGKNTVNENKLNASSTTNTNQALIYGTDNMGVYSPSISCNTATNCNKGFEFIGTNGTPTTPACALWAGNEMKALSKGMVLAVGTGSVAGIIGPQGTTNWPSDNAWTGSVTNGAYADNSVAQLSPLTTRNFSPFAIPSPSGNGPFTPQWYSGASAIFTTSSGAYDCGDFASARNVTVSPTLTTSIQRFSYKNTLYRHLHFNDSIRGAVSALNSFYNNHTDSSVAALVEIEQVLYNGEYSPAASLISGFSPANDAETSYKSFYTLYRSYAEDDFENTSDDDSSALYSLANSCPEVYGTAVYQARSLYNLVFKNVFLFLNSCGGASRFVNPLNENEGSWTGKWDVSIFPNPASNGISILTNRESIGIRVTIVDLGGRILLDKDVQVKNFIAKLDLTLLNGAYIITLSSNAEQPLSKKLIITK